MIARPYRYATSLDLAEIILQCANDGELLKAEDNLIHYSFAFMGIDVLTEVIVVTKKVDDLY